MHQAYLRGGRANLVQFQQIQLSVNLEVTMGEIVNIHKTYSLGHVSVATKGGVSKQQCVLDKGCEGQMIP